MGHRGQIPLLVLAWAIGSFAYADQLPSRPFTTQDGLPVNRINDILADSHGLLWFASDRGLTRFDGYDFQTFNQEDGLPSSVVTALTEAHDGTLWLGVGEQLCHFVSRQPASGNHLADQFTSYTLPAGNEISALFQDRQGQIWCGTRLGLFVLNPLDQHPQLRRISLRGSGDPTISAITEDSPGVIWASSLETLYRIESGQPSQSFHSKKFGVRISSLLADGSGRIWMGTWNGLHLLRSNSEGGEIVEHSWTERDGLSSRVVQNLFRSRDGRLWALTEHGLTGWNGGNGAPEFHKYTDTGGWLWHGLYGMAEDPRGSLWVTTEASGVIRLARNGLTRFQQADGLRSVLIRDVIEDKAQNIIAVTRIDSPDRTEQQRYRGPILNVLKGSRLVPVLPVYPQNLRKPGWGERQIVLQDHCGEWWVATEEGLLHYSAVPVEDLAHTEAVNFYSRNHGLPSSDVFRVAEDRAGNVWIGTMGGGVSVWNRKTKQISHLIAGNAPSELVSDPQGNMWVGWWYSSGLDRYRDGKLQKFAEKDGLPPGTVRGILFDHAGRLWIASTGGLSVTETPTAEVPRFRRYGTKEGLSRGNLFSIAEAPNGRIYIGSDDGLDELDPVTERIRHYGMQDGLPTEEVTTCFRDATGAMWFGTHAGLVRLQPQTRPLQDQVQLRFTSLIAGGQKWPLSKLGEEEIKGLNLDSSHNSFEVRYADLAFGSAGPLRFEYSIRSGSAFSKQDWSAPTTDRTLNIAGLAPGAYRLEVRAVDPMGRVRSSLASLSLSVEPPFWRTWWFDLLLLVIAVAIVSLILHYRVARILAVQEIRARISSDLHDDIGSGLSQIAIWSEIALRDEARNGNAGEALQRIAASSQSLVDSISDIVWTVDPRRDSLRELLQRVRYYASEVCSSQDISLVFNAPERLDQQAADSVLRHDLFLLAKEAINNAAKHSGCTSLLVEVRLSGKILEMLIADDGKGMFQPVTVGNGLDTMRRRALQLAGSVRWICREPQGTIVHITVPLQGKRTTIAAELHK